MILIVKMLYIYIYIYIIYIYIITLLYVNDHDCVIYVGTINFVYNTSIIKILVYVL